VYERNPFFWGVDTAGNQLPYVDRIVLTLAENPEVVNLRAIAGEFDYQDRHLMLDKMPVFLQNQQKGEYKVYLDPTSYGSNIGIVWNHSYADDPEIKKWILNVDFRKAISMGLDKQQFNETFYSGLGQINSGVPAPTNPYYPGAAWDKPAWIAYDLAKANAQLDSLGLDKKDGDGFRLRTDGKGPLKFALSCSPTAPLPTCSAGEMLGQQFKQMGLMLEPQSFQDAQFNDMIAKNMHQFVLWENNSSEVLFEQAGQYIPVNFPNWIGPEISKWFDTGGQQGTPPPDGFDMDKVVDLWRRGRTLPRDQRKPLGQDIWKIMVEKLYHIPFVGLAPAALGIHVAKTGMGNIPRRVAVSSSGQTPGAARTETFYWKS
jgi:peptide/nickel transport system substrate-binding protein